MEIDAATDWSTARPADKGGSRDLQSSHEMLARKLTALENKYDTKFKVVFEAIK